MTKTEARTFNRPYTIESSMEKNFIKGHMQYFHPR